MNLLNYLTVFPLLTICIIGTEQQHWSSVIFRCPTNRAGAHTLEGHIKYSEPSPIGREQKCGVEKGACEMMAMFTSARSPAGWSGFSPRSLVLGSPGLRSFLKKIHEAELK